MGFWTLLLLAVGVSMDAFAVSICKGLSMKKGSMKASLVCGSWFGGFQALMPLIGFFLGSFFAKYIEAIDHWVAFTLLAVIGVNMLRDAFSSGCAECENHNDDLSCKTMLVMAIATSIDALAVGITFALEGFSGGGLNIFTAVLLIGAVTCALSMGGVKIGNIFGSKYEKKAEFVGGVVLIGIGLKILIEGIVELCV